MRDTLPNHVRAILPDPRLPEIVKECGRNLRHANDVIQYLRGYFRDLLPPPLSINRLEVISRMITIRLYPAKTVNAPDRGDFVDSWSDRHLARSWWWKDEKEKIRDQALVEEVGISWLMLYMRDFDDDADVVRGASFVLDRLDELRPRPTSPFDDEDPYRTG